jgi:hypothetical protein
MKAIIHTLLMITLFSTIGFSQTQNRPKYNKSIIELLKENINPGETRMISFNTFNVGLIEINGLKDELILMYSQNVFNANYDQTNNEFSFSYDEYMRKEDLIGLFKKYNMINLLDQKEDLK